MQQSLPIRETAGRLGVAMGRRCVAGIGKAGWDLTGVLSRRSALRAEVGSFGPQACVRAARHDRLLMLGLVTGSG
jgi:hypothetical protein